MFFSADVLNLALFCAQQFGVAIGVGAQTVMYVAYLQSVRDGVVDAEESQFLRAIRRVSFLALVVIIASGVTITLLHVFTQDLVYLTPAYLFKWILIGIILALTSAAGAIPKNYFEALIGANWYAMFMVHTLAPVASWVNLLTWWAVWVVGYTLVWYAAYLLMHERKMVQKAPVQAAPIAEAVVVPAPPKPVEPSKIVLEDKPIMHYAPEPPKPAATPVVPAPVLPSAQPQIKVQPVTGLSIEPSAIPMPAQKTTDTPFLPKVPPLQPIPVGVQPAMQAPAGVAPQPSAVVPSPGQTQPAPSPADSLAINIMPKSPDQLPK